MREKHVGMLVVVEPSVGRVDRVVQGVLTDLDIVITAISGTIRGEQAREQVMRP